MSRQTSSITQVNVTPGQTLQYRFTENPSTGFVWQTSVVPNTVTITKGQWQRGTCPQNAVGCPGSVLFTLVFSSSLRPGDKISIKFIYARAGTTDVSSATVNQFDFTVI